MNGFGLDLRRPLKCIKLILEQLVRLPIYKKNKFLKEQINKAQGLNKRKKCVAYSQSG
jgi:hypothetical protein